MPVLALLIYDAVIVLGLLLAAGLVWRLPEIVAAVRVRRLRRALDRAREEHDRT
jgi:hypothetical protein